MTAGVRLELVHDGDVSVAAWAAERQRDLFQQAFGRELEIQAWERTGRVAEGAASRRRAARRSDAGRRAGRVRSGSGATGSGCGGRALACASTTRPQPARSKRTTSIRTQTHATPNAIPIANPISQRADAMGAR